MNKDTLNTLFVGIDVSSQNNVVCAINFGSKILLKQSFTNDLPGAEKLVLELYNTIISNSLNFITIVLESTGIYSFHIANLLASSNSLFDFSSEVFVIDPKTSKNFRGTYSDIDKTDPKDAYVLADMARCDKITQRPYKASQLFALQRLTRQRFHLVKTIAAEKSYMLSNLYLKFSSLCIAKKEDKPFSNRFGNTSKSILTDFSPDDLVNMSDEDMINYIMEKGKSRFSNPLGNVELLKKACRDSYRLDKLAYEPINVAIATSFNTINALESNLKIIDTAIEKNIKGLCDTEFTILKSISGIGIIFAAGIIAEMGSINFFASHNNLAKYAGITWRKTQSGNFNAETTRLTKTGNKYLRYYFIEAADSVRKRDFTFKEFYTRKYSEVKHGAHKRALSLTARKLVRLIYGLLHHNQLFVPQLRGKE